MESYIPGRREIKNLMGRWESSVEALGGGLEVRIFPCKSLAQSGMVYLSGPV